MSAVPDLKVTAIPLGWMTIERSTMVIGRHYGQSITVPLWGVAISGGPQRILVDTGVHDRAWVDANLGPCKQAPEERLDRALREYVGWSVEDVDIVINTHLHFDHCGGNALLPSATCYVQIAEWDFAAAPLPTQNPYYYEFLIGREALDHFRWRFVSGIVDLMPGVRIFPTPGHTPGHQSVAVRTRDGIVVIAGDCANCMENIVDELPIGIVFDTGQEIASLRRVKKIADFVIPGHDPDVRPGSAGIELHAKLKHLERENPLPGSLG